MKKKLLSVLLAFSLCAVTTASTTLTTGCSSSEVVSEINTVLAAATNVIEVADPNASFIPDLKSAVTALQTAEASWQSGGAVNGVVDALSTIEAITAAIPLTASYSPLIDVLVAGIESVLLVIAPKASTNSVTPHFVANPHVGRVKIAHSFIHKPSTEFKKEWNAAALRQGLTQAVIR